MSVRNIKLTTVFFLLATLLFAQGATDVRVLHELGGPGQQLLDSPSDAAIDSDGAITP